MSELALAKKNMQKHASIRSDPLPIDQSHLHVPCKTIRNIEYRQECSVLPCTNVQQLGTRVLAGTGERTPVAAVVLRLCHGTVSSRRVLYGRRGCVLRDAVSALVLLCVYVTACVLAYHEVEGAQLEAINSGPVHHVTGVKGGRALLPCDITPLHSNDRHVLVLWYKDGIGTPIHSHDSRGSGGRSREWSDFKTFGERVRFDILTQPSSLVLERLKVHDAGLYRCRVDFKRSPTRNARANLTVIIPPSSPEVRLSSGQPVYGMVGPYNEGTQLKLICEAAEGDPPPEVIWKLGHQVVDSSYEWPRPGLATNTLTIPELQREHLHASLVCEASNVNLTAPVATMLTIEMNLKPSSVLILGSREPLSAGREYDIVCQSSQGRPPAVLTWWLDGKQLTNVTPVAGVSGNVSLSSARILASASLNTVSLTCMAQSPVINHRPLEDTWRLEIYYPPQVSLRLGTSLNPEHIKEGGDVYFECVIRANPRAYKIDWFHNGAPLIHNVSGGVIVSNQSLAVQRVNRRQAGLYACAAANTEGDERSEDLQLFVQYPPTCSSDQQRVYGAAREETITVLCRLDASPPVIVFTWRFNSSGDAVDIQKRHAATNGLTSALEYKVKTELDYGTLLCWGSNLLGLQREPCVFRVVPAENPDAPENCTFRNHPNESLAIKCEPGYDGGLRQVFVAEVHDTRTRHMLLNITEATVPYFQLVGIEPDTNFVVRVYAKNAKGSSSRQILRGYTDKDFTERHIAQVRHQPSEPAISDLPIAQILGCAVGIVGSLVLMAIVALLVVRLRRDRNKIPKLQVTITDTKDEDPDLIPNRETGESPRSVSTPVDGGFGDVTQILDKSYDVKSLQGSNKIYAHVDMIPVSGTVIAYPEMVYQIHSKSRRKRRSDESSEKQAILVTSEPLQQSPTHQHIIPRSTYGCSPPLSPRNSSPTSSSYTMETHSRDSVSPVPTVMFRSPSRVTYSSAGNSELGHINPKEYYDSLPYPPDAYHVPINIPTSQVSQVLYHVPRSNTGSEQSRQDSLQYSDTLSEQSDSSTTLQPTKRKNKMSKSEDKQRRSLYPVSTEPHQLLQTAVPSNSLKRQLYVSAPTNYYGYKFKADDHGTRSSVIRPITTKKREITSAFSPLLANQKESEV